MRKVLQAAYRHVDSVKGAADGIENGCPWWYGWAVRQAFLRGAEWEANQAAARRRKLRKVNAYLSSLPIR